MVINREVMDFMQVFGLLVWKKLERPPDNRPVIIPHPAGTEQDHVSNPPEPPAAKRKEFEEAENGRADIEPVHAEQAEQAGQAECRPPVRLAAADILLERIKPLASLVGHGSGKLRQGGQETTSQLLDMVGMRHGDFRSLGHRRRGDDDVLEPAHLLDDDDIHDDAGNDAAEIPDHGKEEHEPRDGRTAFKGGGPGRLARGAPAFGGKELHRARNDFFASKTSLFGENGIGHNVSGLHLRSSNRCKKIQG